MIFNVFFSLFYWLGLVAPLWFSFLRGNAQAPLY